MSRLTLNERQMICGSGVIPGWDAVNYKEMVDEENGALYCIYQVGDGSDLVEVSRYIYSDTIKNNTFYLPSDLQGKGIGLRLLLQEVHLAKLYKMTRLSCFASDSTPDVGYIVWPKMGFDGYVFVNESGNMVSICDSQYLPTPKNFVKMLVSEYIQLFGYQSWLTYGSGYNAILALHPDSYSMRTLYNYAQNKGVL